ncbi:MAG: hypothetical protein RMK91_08015 [Pseudanabaenaceae cyanobacterium SKYGB_i_bin29]|nr:hypothetical protein [Pseudanabaenaceae cyanobacterium SKYG29]MDW8421799.1 hypothetical protein [Pseudanabaenaceae cyanobacterium SKYGB_i_bin29]
MILLVQNLGTFVRIAFLGFSSLPLPLSVAMLFAFLSGGLSAFLWQQLARWIAPPSEKPADNRTETTETEDDEEYDYDDDEDDVIEVEYIDR